MKLRGVLELFHNTSEKKRMRMFVFKIKPFHFIILEVAKLAFLIKFLELAVTICETVFCSVSISDVN